jgi:hypothetical protein
MMSLTDFEQNFVSHIRTLQIKRKSSRKDEGTDFVFLSLKTIKAHYFPKDHEKAIDNLKSQGEIEFLKIKKDNSFYYKFKALKDGPIDFGLLKDECRKLDNLALLIKANLRWVSLEQGIDSTDYFNQFLKQRDKHLDSFFLVDTFSGRIHTPITSLKGAFRKHLYLKNEPVVSLDIGQIQPLLLSLILIENIGKNEFSEWINQGEDIYLMFKEKLNLQSREDAKTKFYEITFGMPNERLGEMFGKADWITWINEVKSIALPQNPNSKTKTHSNLAWLLQSTEVRIMRVIWQKLIDNDILFLTVHDEIIVRVSDLDESYKIMEDELKFYFPSFKINKKDQNSIIDSVYITSKLKKLNCGLLYSEDELLNKHQFSFDEFTFIEETKLILAFDDLNYSLNVS